ncbi:hypothetical protein K435DRAFT_101610 [Dendrothele bispora CBS 962.96]|uniref:RNI-like protein n=1 Tax=Dendrothele bispora (strain CBS 962.96) TaxID=1314807 RepID=A0A4S8M2L5_DENBC|nr:hypothetical protein K435DRAFT_101610 [Dendrothele bispora CBS 962.96]
MKAVPKEDMSKLEAVSIRKEMFLDDSPQFNDALNHFLALGSLRALHLYNYDTFDHRASVGFRWEQLTELTLVPIDHGGGGGPTLTLLTALDILSRAKSLRSCTIKLTVGEDHDAIVQNRTQPAITLPFLHTLDLYLAINLRGVLYANQDDVIHIFNRLVTPSLKTLMISSWIAAVPPPFSAHIPFLCLLSQPAVKIETLNISCHSNPRSYIDCLQLTPHLRSLSMNGCIGNIPDTTRIEGPESTYSYEELFQSLNPPDGSIPPLCPKLEGIQFIYCQSLPDPMTLLDVFKTRMPGNNESKFSFPTLDESLHSSGSMNINDDIAPNVSTRSTLKVFGVKYSERHGPVTAELIDRVSRLREQGLDLYIRLPRPQHRKRILEKVFQGSTWADSSEFGKPGVEYYKSKDYW